MRSSWSLIGRTCRSEKSRSTSRGDKHEVGHIARLRLRGEPTGSLDLREGRFFVRYAESVTWWRWITQLDGASLVFDVLTLPLEIFFGDRWIIELRTDAGKPRYRARFKTRDPAQEAAEEVLQLEVGASLAEAVGIVDAHVREAAEERPGWWTQRRTWPRGPRGDPTDHRSPFEPSPGPTPSPPEASSTAVPVMRATAARSDKLRGLVRRLGRGSPVGAITLDRGRTDIFFIGVAGRLQWIIYSLAVLVAQEPLGPLDEDRWRVDLRSADGELLHRASFKKRDEARAAIEELLELDPGTELSSAARTLDAHQDEPDAEEDGSG